MRKWLNTAQELQQLHCDLLAQHGHTECKLRQRLDISFVSWLTQQIPEADASLPSDLLHGFQMVGTLPPCRLEAEEVPKKHDAEGVPG